MPYCHKCKTGVQGSSRRCPLCGGDLDGAPCPEQDVFPVIPPSPPASRGLITFFAFATITVAALSVAINVSFFSGGVWWFLFVIAGLGSLWLPFLVLRAQWWNIPRIIFWELFLISILVFVWDLFTGFYKWSFNFVIPILFGSAMVVMSVFSKLKKWKVQDYIIFLGVISVVSIFSLLLIIFHVVTPVYPAALCFAVSVISLAFIVLFDGAPLQEELKRRMHL
jgi:hypothetical protein